RQRGKQPQPGRRRAGRGGSLGRQVDHDEALPHPWSRQVDPHPEAVLAPPDRRPRNRRRRGGLIMGHKSNPIGLRLQINRTWDSRWYAEGKNYQQMLKEDLEIRKYVVENLPQAAISKVVIERPAKLCRVSIYAARPGVIIGKKGADIEKLRSKLASMTDSDVKLNI